MTSHRSRRILVLAGPTAAGKSALALDLAEYLGGELVNADSVQLRRGLDIGSAKPTADERARVPHHLLDLLEPEHRYTVADFVRDADAAIAAIAARDALPIVVGGSGLYLRSLLHGLAPAAIEDLGARQRWQTELERCGPEPLHDALMARDPETAAGIHPRDGVRLVRALEVLDATGRPLAQAQRAHGLQEQRYDAATLVLTAPRAWLHHRIEARASAMVAQGLRAEVRALLEAGVSRAALGAIGYRQAVDALDTGEDDEELAAKVAVATRRFARRQRTWFRHQITGHWIAGPLPAEEVARLAEAVGAWWKASEGLPRAGWPTEEAALAAPGTCGPR